MGRTYLSVKLAIGFAVCVALLAVAAERGQSGAPFLRTQEDSVELDAAPGDLVCDHAHDAVLTAVAVPSELLDTLPLWRGSERRDCPAGRSPARRQEARA